MHLEITALERVLAGVPLFSGLKADCLAGVARHCRMLDVDRGETLFRKGDEAEGFYCVFDGKVKLFFVSERGTEKIVEILQPGMTFGEAVVFLDEPYPVFAETMAPSHLLFIHRDGVLEGLRQNNQMALRLLSGLSKRLHQLMGGMEAICVMSSRERVTGYLLNELEHAELEVLELPSTKAVVASTLNLTPETFSRVLHGLEKEGVIRIQGRRIELLDPNKLRERVVC